MTGINESSKENLRKLLNCYKHSFLRLILLK